MISVGVSVHGPFRFRSVRCQALPQGDTARSADDWNWNRRVATFVGVIGRIASR